jgi:pyruvate formate lyase activating enzyme
MNTTSQRVGVLFDIQRYSIHDGPGIRTLVFMKGCPMKCIWCQNPESQRIEREVMFYNEKCTGCGQCVQVCPQGAIKIFEGRSLTDMDICTGHAKCVEVCPNEARSLVGKYVSVDEVFKEVMKDRAFYKRSGGGITISGGESTSQPDFVTDLLAKCQEAAIHTAIETCGCVGWEILENVVRHTDLVLYDLKLIDSAEHVKYTGVSNNQILDNARRLSKAYAKLPMVVRVPIIPGYTDSIKNIEGIAKFVSTELGDSARFELLNYNPLGETKYERLGRQYGASDLRPVSDESIARLREIMTSYGLKSQGEQ